MTTTAVAVALLGAGGCSVVSDADRVTSVELSVCVGAPSALSAWVAADVLRRALRCADPNPSHPGAPALDEGEGHYRVLYAGPRRARGPNAVRAAMNGRLLPPTLGIRAETERLTLFNPQFAPSPEATTEGDADGIHVDLRITPLGPHASHVRAAIRGDADIRRTLVHVESALLLAENAWAASFGVHPRAQLSQRPPVDRDLHCSGCCAAHQLLRAPLLHALSLAAAAAGEADLARIELDRAADCAPNSVALRARLAHLDERLARPQDAARTWARIYATRDLGLAGRRVAARVREAQRLARNNLSVRDDFEQARAALRRSDRDAGRAWLQRAARFADPTCLADELAVDWDRRRADPKTAWARSLARFEGAREERACSAFEMLEDGLAAGEHRLVLHTLSTEWNALTQADAPRAEAILTRCLTTLGPEDAARMLATRIGTRGQREDASGTERLAAQSLEAWRAVARRSARLGIDLVERTHSSLRPGHSNVGEEDGSLRAPHLLGDGFESAPGIRSTEEPASPPRD